MIKPVPVITIDGPSGSGKGTVAALLAGKLGWNFLDSGALYRLLAFAARNHGVDLTNEEALKVLAEHLDVQFGAARDGHGMVIILGRRGRHRGHSQRPSVRVLPRSRRCRWFGPRCCNGRRPFARPPAWLPTGATWEPSCSPMRR